MVQRYGDFRIPTIPFVCHSIYQTFGILFFCSILNDRNSQHKAEDGGERLACLFLDTSLDKLLVHLHADHIRLLYVTLLNQFVYVERQIHFLRVSIYFK